jgi:hypothetical protein
MLVRNGRRGNVTRDAVSVDRFVQHRGGPMQFAAYRGASLLKKNPASFTVYRALERSGVE